MTAASLSAAYFASSARSSTDWGEHRILWQETVRTWAAAQELYDSHYRLVEGAALFDVRRHLDATAAVHRDRGIVGIPGHLAIPAASSALPGGSGPTPHPRGDGPPQPQILQPRVTEKARS